MKDFSKNSIFILVISALFLTAVFKTYAVPSTYFDAGETLDPLALDGTCTPGTCSVYPLSIGDVVGNGNISSVLFIDSTGNLAEDNSNFLYDNSDGTLYTDVISLANNLLITTTSSSSVGVVSKDGTRFLHTYKPAGTNDNLFFGKGSGNFTLSATSNFNANTGIGENTLASLSTGYFNTALGAAALRFTTTGNNNTALGLQAGNRITTGTYNTAIGRDAMYGASSPSSASGSYNVAVGNAPLYSLSTGSNNIAIGYQAGFGNTTGGNNVFIGYESGHDITTESGNVFIGYQSGADATGSNKLYIENSNSESPLIYGDFSSDIVSINGKLGIGDSTPSASLTVGSGDLFQVNSSGIARAPSASAGTPAYSFTADTDTGIYLPNDGEIGFAVASAVKGKITSQGILVPDGGVALPGLSFIDNNDTGFFNPGVGIGISVDGVQIAILDADGILDFDDGGIDIPATTDNVSGVIKQAGSVIYHSYGSTSNIFLGKDSGNFSLTGSDNTVVGVSSGTSITSGASNSIFGYQAGTAIDSGAQNTIIGYNAGNTLTDGGRNVLIGYGANTSSSSINSSIGIGRNVSVTASNQFVLGGDGGVSDVYFGNGVTNVTPVSFTLNASGGSGTDIAGADITIASGKGTGNATGGDIIFSTSDAGVSGTTLQSLTEKVRITNAGRLGIGTDSPGFEIEVAQDTQNVEIVGSAYGGRKTVFGGRGANGTAALPTASQTGDILAEFSGLGYGDTAFAPSTTGGLRVYAEQNFTDSAWGTQLRFMTTGLGSTTLSQRMAITADGNVGIGDSTPDELLNISSTTSNGIAITSVGADVDPYIKFELVDGTSSFTMGVDDSDGDSFKISTTGLGTSDRFIIDSSGNVNVGGDGTPGDLFSVGSTSQFQINSSGAITAVTGIVTSGAVTVGSSGTGALNVGTTSGVYRTTNGGSNVTPQTVFDVDNSNSTAGSQAYIFDTNSGLVFTAANGTRRIARASIDIVNLTNTANSETGDLAFFTKPSGSAITEKMRIDSTGKVGIGDTSPDYLLDVENTGADTDIFALTDSDGACLHNPEAGAETVTCSSDERLKENITDAGEILPFLTDFRIREYDVRSSGDHMIGVIAQEVMVDYPQLVKMGGNGFYTVELPSTWQIVKGIQELDVRIKDIESLDITNENSFANILTAWFNDATNGIQNIFTKKVTTEELCIEDVCITKDDLQNILNQNGGIIIQNNNQGGETSGEENTDNTDGETPNEEQVPVQDSPSEESQPDSFEGEDASQDGTNSQENTGEQDGGGESTDTLPDPGI